MSWAVVLIMQATAPQTAVTAGPADVDLTRATRDPLCDRTASEQEVVVCGKRDRSPYRLPILPAGYGDPKPPVAETRLGGGVSGNVHVEQQSVGGVPSNRIMVGITKPF